MLLKVDNEKAREYYMLEAVSQNWSTRDLQRQINTQYLIEKKLLQYSLKPAVWRGKRMRYTTRRSSMTTGATR